MQDQSPINYVQVLEFLQYYLLTMPVSNLVVNGKLCDVNMLYPNATLSLTLLGKTRRSLKLAKKNPTIAESFTVHRHQKLCGIMV
jgi:hypothetical protein